MRKQTWAMLLWLALEAAPASALKPGDLVVVVDGGFLIAVDPKSGEVETLLGGDVVLGFVTGVAVDTNGGIYLTRTMRLDPESLWHRDSETGVWSRLADLEPGEGGVAIAPDGVLLMPRPLGVTRVDPQTGQRIGFVRFDPSLGRTPIDIAVEATGEILLSVIDLSGTAPRGIVRVDPDTGAWEELASSAVVGIAVEADGSILGAVPGRPGQLLRLNPANGLTEVVSAGGLLSIPLDVAIEADGQIVVSDDSTFLGGDAVIVRVDPANGTQSLVIGGFRSIGTVAVVPPELEIDIQPSRLTVGTNSRRTLRVTLFGSDLVDVEDIDVGSLAFGPAGASPLRSSVVRGGRDEFPRLLLFFRAEEAGLAPGHTEACLTGTVGVFRFEACDEITVRDRGRRVPRRATGRAP